MGKRLDLSSRNAECLVFRVNDEPQELTTQQVPL